jgi:hypothetical protein
VKTEADRFAEAMEAAEIMFAEMLRTFALAVLLGTDIGFGWHYFVDRGGPSAAASAAISPAKHDVLNPPSPNPPAQRAGPIPDVAGSPIFLPDVQQPARGGARPLQ